MESKFSHVDAVAWSVGVTLGWMFGVSLLLSISREAQHDLVMLGGAQVAVYLTACALFAARRPGKSWSELFATRRTSIPLALAALALGVALYPLAELLAALVERWFPLPKEQVSEQVARLTPRNVMHGIALALVVVGAGPFVEELFFRGALFTALRKGSAAFAAAGTTSLLFTIGHPEPRTWPPILVLACVLGYLRALGGSLWPGLLLHAGFNATALGMTLAFGDVENARLPPPLLIASGVISCVLLGAAALFGRKSSMAARARELDEGAASTDGALP